jgi:hypothetical protein
MIPAYDLKKPRQPGKPPSVTSDFCVCLSMEDNRSMGGQNTLMSKYKIQLYFSILYLVFCKVFCLPLQSISIIRGSFNLIKLYSRKNISKTICNRWVGFQSKIWYVLPTYLGHTNLVRNNFFHTNLQLLIFLDAGMSLIEISLLIYALVGGLCIVIALMVLYP